MIVQGKGLVWVVKVEGEGGGVVWMAMDVRILTTELPLPLINNCYNKE